MNRTLIVLITGAMLTGALAMAEDKVDQRVANQQKRVGQGLQTGSLTTKEGANLEKKEAGLRKEVHNDRVANGGKLTGAEKAQVNKQQNKLSNQIYNKKHNDKTR
ncbi:MAG TPA: hypothetical protein VGL53_20795 [Bryobacteraceae bacterium]|jgi:threonine aldolase